MSGRRRGRRPGSQDTREAILAAARTAFAEGGYDATSVRRIAAAAGVDPALVHHYFTTKEQLFQAAVAFPVDLPTALAGIAEGPVAELGDRLADTFLGAWEHPRTGPALEALLRSALTSQVVGRLVREFFTRHIVRSVGVRLADVVPATELPVRAGFVASQLFGLAVVRYLLRFEPIASAPRDSVRRTVGPTLQSYLTGPVDDLPEAAPGPE